MRRARQSASLAAREARRPDARASSGITRSNGITRESRRRDRRLRSQPVFRLLSSLLESCPSISGVSSGSAASPVSERRFGAARGIRTPDPIITNDVLYQLSYCGPCGSWRPRRREQAFHRRRPFYRASAAFSSRDAQANEPISSRRPQANSTAPAGAGFRPRCAPWRTSCCASGTELSPIFGIKSWCRKRDSNPRPHHYE